MSNPFESSHRKIARAEEHFRDLERVIVEYIKGDVYERVIEPHPDEPGHIVHKVRLTEMLPASVPDITADVVQNLRNALDNAGYSVAVASGRTNPKFSAFPFAGSVDQMASSLGRSKDVPPQIQSLFCGFQPYPGGDDFLWALNEICISDKHKTVLPVGTAVITGRASFLGFGYVKMPDTHVWDRSKNEMELITMGREAKYDYNLDFSLLVAFHDIRVVDGKEVLAVLNLLCRKVHSILMAIETESRRLKIVK